LAPTLVELAGSLSPAGFEGVSLAPLFHDQDPVSLGITESFAAVGRLRSLTTDQWHFTFNERNGETRLYRLASDPGGHQDLSREHPAVVEAFLSELEELDNLKALTAREALELAGDLPLYPDNAIDSEIRKQLEALGYVEN
jgi:arylsulfatase A-like enzyme